MFHVELRQAGHHVRAFNLSDEQVHSGFVVPLRSDRLFIYEDIEFDPRRTQLRVLEGPQLRMDQLTLGRGWTEAERSGNDVTERFTAGAAPAAVQDRDAATALKDRIIGRVGAGPVPLAQLAQMAAELLPGRRASEQLAAVEIAVWELLHKSGLTLFSEGEQVPAEHWEAIVLDLRAWLADGQVTLGKA